MKQLPISVIILTNRSDELFVQSLQSAQFAAEVIVVDNNSENDWRQLAKTHTFTLFRYQDQITNFAEVRNWAMKQTQHDWVLFLDSDEMLTKSAPEQLQRVLLEDLYDGLYLLRSDIFHGRQLQHGEAGNQPILRLFKKDLTHFNRAIHEVAKVNGTVGQSEIRILHYAHPNISSFLASVAQYSLEIGETYPRDKLGLLLELLLFPPAKFMHNYLLRLGFLDGWPGLVYAVIMSLHSLTVRARAYEKNYPQHSR